VVITYYSCPLCTLNYEKGRECSFFVPWCLLWRDSLCGTSNPHFREV